MDEVEWRDFVRQYLRGLEAQIAALRGLEARVAALEVQRRAYERRPRVGRPWACQKKFTLPLRFSVAFSAFKGEGNQSWGAFAPDVSFGDASRASESGQGRAPAAAA